MAEIFVYITAKKLENNKVDYLIRVRNTPEEYLKDLEESRRVGYKLFRSFAVNFGSLPALLQACNNFANRQLSTDSLDSFVDNLIKNQGGARIQ